MAIQQFNHIAIRCRDADETTDFYVKVMGLRLAWAVSADVVGSTGEHHPHLHIFFALQDGSCMAFFELLDFPEPQKDPNTPDWVQHIAFTVSGMDELLAAKARLEGHGLSVLGPKIGHRFDSIYFFDPNGHRLEYTYLKAPMGEAEATDARRVMTAWRSRKGSRTEAAVG